MESSSVTGAKGPGPFTDTEQGAGLLSSNQRILAFPAETVRRPTPESEPVRRTEALPVPSRRRLLARMTLLAMVAEPELSIRMNASDAPLFVKLNAPPLIVVGEFEVLLNTSP